MLDKSERSALIKSIVLVVKEWMSAALNTVTDRLNEFDQRIKAIPAGPQGEKGIDGKDGSPGRDGQPGLDGKPGIPGKDGLDGKDGVDGLSCNVDGVIAEVLAKMPIPKDGRDGKDGTVGESGRDGKDGLAGLDGKEGPQGQNGKDGKDGRDGRDGIAGQNGRDGQDGKDALQIEILSMIDPEKSYPRGTRAFYAGGEIHAMRNTAPIVDGFDKSGWEVANNGIADIVAILNDDLRTFSFRFVQTNGRTVEFNLKSPVQIQRGIFKDGNEYARGDAVVSDNSTWTCMVESTKARPGTSPDWLLSARKGGQGRDGKDGAPGPVGKPGKDGRDFTRMGMAGQ